MSHSYAYRQVIAKRLAEERGTLIRQTGGLRVALLYPSPYHVGMSSLGFQAIYRVINTNTTHACERAFLPDSLDRPEPILSYESLTPLGDFDVIAVSFSFELELIGLIECLRRAGLEPLAADRGPSDPLVVLGGPITFSNPLPCGPFSDAVVMGEGEQAIVQVLDCIAEARSRGAALEQLAAIPGVHVPAMQGEQLIPVAKADDAVLPAYSQIITPDTELSSMHLVEAERGCHRRCTFCVMRRSTNGGMRIATPEAILDTIPEHAERVGLVGAAVTDHPGLLDIVGAIVESGRSIGISSLRADRLKPELVDLLQRGGYRTLTVASDGASERLRRAMQKSIRAHHLRHAADMVARFQLRTLKLYMMLGVPDETDEDIEELIDFTRELTGIAPVAMTISPFVAKKNTPLDGEAFAGVDLVDRRTKRLREALRSVADLRSSSARWAWVEYCLAQGGFEMAQAAIEAHAQGGRFAAWKRAVKRHAPHFLDMLRTERSGGRRSRRRRSQSAVSDSSVCVPVPSSGRPRSKGKSSPSAGRSSPSTPTIADSSTA